MEQVRGRKPQASRVREESVVAEQMREAQARGAWPKDARATGDDALRSRSQAAATPEAATPEADVSKAEASGAQTRGAEASESRATTTPTKTGPIMAVYLMGLVIGGLYMGMVSPARTVIQNGFGIDDVTGIWMINIYSLFYAALIPIIGKMADRRGRKAIFLVCVALFGVGSLMCGLSSNVGGFGFLLAGRVVQAAGAGGMIPVANAEIGTTFPPEKRGAALGIAAATTGLANVLGAGVGSAIIGAVGAGNWAVMFYLGVPFCIVLVIAGAMVLPHRDMQASAPMDLAGSVLFALFVLMLLVGLKGIDFFDFAATASRPAAWVPLLVAVVILPVFRLVERRAADPVFHMEYFHNRAIVVTMAVSFFIGCCVISMVLVPEFAEFAMGDPAGSGGYYLLAIGVTTLFGPPLGGKLIDRFGPKPVLIGGFIVEGVGYLSVALVAAANPTPVLLVVGLLVIGLGMGFAMGAPTNYMILENTRVEEAGSAIATITLVRQVGTSIAPAILVGFISRGTGMLGYRQMLVCVAVFCAISIALMVLYRSPSK